MSATPDAPAQRKAYWPVPIVRALPTAALALWITFSADHSAMLGLLSFGVFGVVTGLVELVLAWLRQRDSRAFRFIVAQAVITLVTGALALVAPGAGARYLFVVLIVFAVLTGFLELYIGVSNRGRHAASIDWITTGAITVALAIAIVVIPQDYSQTFHDPDGVDRTLDAGVVTVGLLGGYAAIVAVYLLIAGFSAKWGTQKTSAAATSTDASAQSGTTA